VLWGAYLATGDEEPITRLLKLLPWSADTESIDKLTIGNMAKYTLADNASRSSSTARSVEDDVTEAAERDRHRADRSD
jgi:hypothetical protein